jgi:hypothetical protein
MQEKVVFPTAEEVKVLTLTKMQRYPYLTQEQAQDVALYDLTSINDKSCLESPTKDLRRIVAKD